MKSRSPVLGDKFGRLTVYAQRRKTMPRPVVNKDAHSSKKPVRRSSCDGQVTLQEQLAELRHKTGETDIKTIAPDIWLMRLGVLVDLDICRFRGTVSLNEEDLGLALDAKEQAVFDELMTIGSKKLLPPEYFQKFNSLDTGARKHLRDHAYHTRWGEWVDVGRYATWKQGNELFRAAYMALGKKAHNEWDGKIAEWRKKQYAIAASGAYARIKRMNPTGLRDTQGAVISELDFIAAYVARIEERVPTKEEFLKSLDFRVELSYIPLPSMLAKDLQEKERIEAKRALAQTQEKTLLEDGAILDEMHADATGSALRDAHTITQEFVRDLQAGTLERIVEHLTSAKASVDKNGKIVGKVAEQIRNSAATYQAMNLVKSKGVDEHVAALKQAMDTPATQRHSADVEKLIDNVLRAAKATLKTLKH